MAFDGIITKSIVSELYNNILGCKVNKIYEPTNHDIIFNLYGNGSNFDLAICTNSNLSRVHLTKYSKPNPMNAPNFCMFLRKHLVGAKVLNVESFDLERIICISFECYNELNDKVFKKLYIEIMGQFSNIILVNENGTILDCLNHVVTKSRELLPVRPYIFPENNKQSFSDINYFDEFYKIFTSNFSSSIDKTFSDLFIGMSRSFIQSICDKLNIDLASTSKEDLKLIFDYIKNILNNINTLNVCCYTTKNGKDYYLDVSNTEQDLAISTFLDKFYFDKEQVSLFTTYRDFLLNFLLSTLNKYKKRLVHIEEKLKDCDKMEDYRLFGELLTANLYRIKDSSDSIEVLNYYTNSNVTIPLDSTISPSKNVERYYKKFNKCKNTLDIVGKQKKETEEELSYMEGLIYSIQDCQDLSELQEIGTEIAENFSLNMSNSRK